MGKMANVCVEVYGPVNPMGSCQAQSVYLITFLLGRLCLFVWVGLNVAFNNLSVISRRCLDVAGSSMLTFRVLPHWNITPQTLWHDIPLGHIILTLSWPVPIPSSTFLMLSAKRKSSYCAFDIFQKVVFCLTLYTEEVNLQIFVMI